MKKWANKAFDEANEGSLTKLGWPNGAKLVEAARRDRKKVVGKLLLLANGSKDSATKTKARAILDRIKNEVKD